MRCYVVGDIHGCSDELIYLVEHLPLEPCDRLVFLGDYVDRGPDSKGVISYLIQKRQQITCIFLKGNHEDMLLAYLGLPGRHADMFLYNGGGTTLASYGISSRTLHSAEILSRMPPSHIEFLKNLQIHYLTEPFLCVHGGIHPLRTLEEQKEEEILWIRQEFIYNRHRLPYTVLFGHTPQNEVLLDLPYKVGLDTGLVYGNKLTCLELQEKVIFQIGRGQKKINRTALRAQWKGRIRSPAS